MTLSNLFAFLVACFTFISAMCLIYHESNYVMTFSGWALLSYLCYLIALTQDNNA